MANKFTKFYTCKGLTMNLQDWEKESGIPFGTIRARLRSGMCFAEAITTPLRNRVENNTYTVNGLTLPLSTWCQFMGVSKQSLDQAAKRRGETSLSALIKKVEASPHLFPHHLLTVKTKKGADVPDEPAIEAVEACKTTIAEHAELLATYEARIKELENELARLTHNV